MHSFLILFFRFCFKKIISTGSNALCLTFILKSFAFISSPNTSQYSFLIWQIWNSRYFFCLYSPLAEIIDFGNRWSIGLSIKQLVALHSWLSFLFGGGLFGYGI